MVAATSPKKRMRGQPAIHPLHAVSIPFRGGDFREMPADSFITIKVRPGIARVQDTAVEWLKPPAGLAEGPTRIVASLLPMPKECHPSATAWTVLPSGGWVVFVRHRRDGADCLVEVWVVSRSDYRRCLADAPAIIRAVEADPLADTAQVFETTRSAAELLNILKTGDTPTLLGAAQLLVDGGKVHFPDNTPVPLRQVASLWDLLPTRQRAVLGWTTYLNSKRHSLAIGAGSKPAEGAWGWEQAGDYPEGDYERSLHQAASQGDEDTVRRLLNRGSRADVMVLGLLLLGALAIGQIILASTGWKPPPLIRQIPREHAP